MTGLLYLLKKCLSNSAVVFPFEGHGEASTNKTGVPKVYIGNVCCGLLVGRSEPLCISSWELHHRVPPVQSGV